jgi:hypothetical protein
MAERTYEFLLPHQKVMTTVSLDSEDKAIEIARAIAMESEIMIQVRCAGSLSPIYSIREDGRVWRHASGVKNGWMPWPRE